MINTNINQNSAAASRSTTSSSEFNWIPNSFLKQHVELNLSQGPDWNVIGAEGSWTIIENRIKGIRQIMLQTEFSNKYPYMFRRWCDIIWTRLICVDGIDKLLNLRGFPARIHALAIDAVP